MPSPQRVDRVTAAKIEIVRMKRIIDYMLIGIIDELKADCVTENELEAKIDGIAKDLQWSDDYVYNGLLIKRLRVLNKREKNGIFD
jgi:hypothetical protein